MMKTTDIKTAQDYVGYFKTVFVGDYKKQFEKETDKLINIHIDNVKERTAAVDYLVERYVTDTDERPDSYELNRLASHLLYEYLEGDNDPDKMTNQEIPVMTETQKDRRLRDRGEFYTSFDGANTIGSDRKEYRPSMRRKRRAYENNNVDKQAQEYNRTRNAIYKEQTSPSKITTYYTDAAGMEKLKSGVDKFKKSRNAAQQREYINNMKLR